MSKLVNKFKGRSQETIGGPLEALKTYEAGLPYIATISPSSRGSPEQKIWTERFLARFCMLASRSFRYAAEKSPGSEDLFDFGRAIAPFRAWANFFNGMPSQGVVQVNATEPEENFRRRDIWQAYYNTLSLYLQRNAALSASHLKDYKPLGGNHDSQDRNMPDSKSKQYEELSRVETIYEGLLLKEVSFPNANQTNIEVDDWTDQVMANWRVICGPSWQNDDLGPGGQEAAGRKVLDVRNFKSSKYP